MTSLTVSGAAGRTTPRIGRTVPAADFPPLPTVSLEAFLPLEAPDVRSVLDAGDAVLVTAGRFAIALALQAMDVKAGDRVLVPAYHCTTMVEPLKCMAARPVFYKLKDDLSPDLEDIAAKLDADARVLMVTHYFGFPQDMQRIREFCDARGLKLLEDCAHSFFGEAAGRPLGAYGDFAIASPTKFFPLNDGGCLISRDGAAAAPKLRRQGAFASLTAAAGELKRAHYYGNLSFAGPFIELARGLRNFWRGRRQAFAHPEGAVPQKPAQAFGTAVASSNDFDPSRIDLAMSGYSGWIFRNVARSRIVAKRRRNYRLLVSELEGLAGCRPLLPQLPERVVPYEVPFWIDDLSCVFPRLEDMAIPMHRFGQFLHPDMAEGVCPVAEAMSRHLVQFPCHQDLSEADVVRIAARIRAVLAG